MRGALLGLCLLLAPVGAWAASFVMPGGQVVRENKALQCKEADVVEERRLRVLDFDGADFNVDCASGECNVALGPDAVQDGAGQIGASSDLEATIDMQSKKTILPAATSTTGTDCDATGEAGGVVIDTDGPRGAREYLCTGTGGYEAQGGRLVLLGGDGSDGAFTFNGAADTTCAGGTVSGSSPNKVCTLTPNSTLSRMPQDTGTTLYSCVYNYSTFNFTGGSITCGGAFAAISGAPQWGAALVIRVQGSPTVTGGTFDMSSKGGAAGTGGTSGGTGSNRAGGVGGYSTFFAAGANGAAGKNNGSAGNNAVATPKILPFLFPLGIGLGGGGGAGSGSVGANAVSAISAFFGSNTVMDGATGGGGGGCASGVASGTGGDGGRGGGMIWLETAGTYACSGATYTVAGQAGASGKAGGAGGGGGKILVLYRDLGSDSCTYTKGGGGAGSTSDSTNCGTSGAGGDGVSQLIRAPF